MYNSVQILYIVISLLATVGLLVGGAFIKKQKHKDLFLKTFALATFVVHISIMWVDFLKSGSADAPDNILFPIYFCNLAMYLLITVAFMKNKNSKLFNILATFTAYAGMFGALITLFENHYFAGENPVLSYYNFKSMISHSLMLVGSLYLFVGGYVKVKVKNALYFVYGLAGCFVLGTGINLLFAACNLPAPNAMFLQASAVDGVSFLTGYFIGPVMLVLIFVFTVIFEMFAFKKGDRWYNHLKSTFKKVKKK